MNKQALVFASCSLGVVFLCGFSVFEPSCLAQTSLAVDTASPVAKDDIAKHCLESTCRNAPIREKLSAIPLGTKYVRGIFGGFEQGAGIGGGVQLTSADVVPALELRATALTSTRYYKRYDLEGYFPNIAGSRNHADMWFSYMRRESDFFGIGPRISQDLKTAFSTEQRSYQASLYRDITDRLQAGVYTQVTNTYSLQGQITEDTPINESFSGTPNQLAPWIPGFRSNTKILSNGIFLEYDGRDNTAGLTHGVNLYGRVASSDGLVNHAAFADYGWTEAEVDIRGYIPLGTPRTSLAMRSELELKKPKGGSQIPFYDLSWIGGREYVRGYELYRFRGNNALLFSTELRHTVYSKSDTRGVDVFGFADSGQVWGDARLAYDDRLSSSNWHSGVGGGLQYRHSRSLAARLEVARSNEDVVIYLAMSRSF
jgi:outer membrane protein assembly factor BamA